MSDEPLSVDDVKVGDILVPLTEEELGMRGDEIQRLILKSFNSLVTGGQFIVAEVSGEWLVNPQGVELHMDDVPRFKKLAPDSNGIITGQLPAAPCFCESLLSGHENGCWYYKEERAVPSIWGIMNKEERRSYG